MLVIDYYYYYYCLGSLIRIMTHLIYTNGMISLDGRITKPGPPSALNNSHKIACH